MLLNAKIPDYGTCNSVERSYMYVCSKMHSRREDNIFGTPPEPLFNMKAASLAPEILEEWLILLAKENSKFVGSADIKQYVFRKGHTAEIIFLLSDRLRLRNDAKYLALELFNRFMIQHINDLYRHVQNSGSLTQRKDWLAIQERVQNQLVLRVVSCCQLASKLTSHYRIVTVSRAQRFMAETGHQYTHESILKSELRVLKTLDFKVNILSPLMYLECLLEIMGHNEPGTEVKVYHGIAMKLLDFVYMKHDDIFKRLYQTAGQQTMPDPSERSKLAAVEADKMLLAVGIITASVFIVDQQNMKKVLVALEKISRIPQEDMLDLCTVLIKAVTQKGADQ